MKIFTDKKLREIKIFKPKTFSDFRGKIWTKWEKKFFKNIKFNLSKYTTSKKNVLRGFHGDSKSWKLVTCIKGEVLNVVVDYRKSSKNYLKYSSFVLNDKNKISVLIPPMFLNSWLNGCKKPGIRCVMQIPARFAFGDHQKCVPAMPPQWYSPMAF